MLNTGEPNASTPQHHGPPSLDERRIECGYYVIYRLARYRQTRWHDDLIANFHLLDVDWHVDKHGAHAASYRNRIGLREFSTKIIRTFHHSGIFRDWANHLDNLRLLEARLAHFRTMIGATFALVDLPCDVQRRNRVEE